MLKFGGSSRLIWGRQFFFSKRFTPRKSLPTRDFRTTHPSLQAGIPPHPLSDFHLWDVTSVGDRAQSHWVGERPESHGTTRQERTSFCKHNPTLRQTWPRVRPEAAMCVRKISAQCVLQFTPSLAAGCVLHRPVSRVIHCSELYFHFIFEIRRPLFLRSNYGQEFHPGGRFEVFKGFTETITPGCRIGHPESSKTLQRWHRDSRTLGGGSAEPLFKPSATFVHPLSPRLMRRGTGTLNRVRETLIECVRVFRAISQSGEHS